MRLLSLHVRNYRLHHDLKVEFDSHRTLIGGRNETGKSTLVEAAHNALFLSHRRGGQDLESMKSDYHSDLPEVDLEFECGGTRYLLKKRFGGAAKGSAELSSGEHERWTANDAEDKLAELLGLDGPVSAAQASSQWGHLWIRQGLSGNDPSDAATDQKDALLAQLQEQGGAVVMQSDRDAQVATLFADQHSERHTSTGKVSASSDLGQAEAKVSAAAATLESAKAKADRLEDAVQLFRQSQETLSSAEASLRKLEKEQKDTEKQLHEVETLQSAEEKHQRTLTEFTAHHERLSEADAKIRDLETTVAKLTETLAPKRGQLEKLRSEQRAAEKRAAQGEKQLKSASACLQETRRLHELAQHHVDHFRVSQRLSESTKLKKQIDATRKKLVPLNTKLSSQPDLDTKGLEKLRKLDEKRSNARAALEAMATGIEWTAGKGPVTISGRKLKLAQGEVLSEDSELVIGDTHIMIRPGGGTGLAKARQLTNETEEALQDALRHLGLEDLEAARRCVDARQALDTEIANLHTQLDTLDPEAVEEQLEELTSEQLGLTSTIDRLASQVTDYIPPKSAKDAGAALTDSAAKLTAETTQEDQAKGQLEAEQETLELSRKSISQGESQLRLEEHELTAQTSSRDTLVELHGEKKERLTLLSKAALARDQADQELTKVQKQLEELQADQLQALRASLVRSMESKQQLKSEADRNLASAKATLASDGTSDPYNDLATAEATLERESESRDAIERQASAIKRLADLFRSEQQELADQFTAPLAEKITGYLQTLFGPTASAKVSLNADGFQGLELVRHQGIFEFAGLSGGTKEQLAAAVRLAIAELLAADHDDCLPLVFDDAFTNSDPERIHSLQRMLDLAATRGLQIIILSCTPSDYDTLGATEIVLQPIAISSTTPSASDPAP